MKKILIIGYGSIGKRHVKNILDETSYEIIILTKRKDKIQIDSNRVKIFHNLNDCLSEKPHIGFITNETAYHIEIATKLAKSGLDLFLEKPLSNSMDGIKSLQKIVKQKKLITQMGYNLRFHESLIKTKKLLEQEKIGKIISVQAENGSYFPDWHPYEDYRLSYAGKKTLGGGIILTQIHDVDYLYWFFKNPKSVFSMSGKFSNLDITAEDYCASIIQFPKNITVELHLDFFQGPEFRSFKIKGTNGILSWNSLDNKIRFYDNRKKEWRVIYTLKNFQRNKMYVNDHNLFSCLLLLFLLKNQYVSSI